ncbi:MAG: very short patch repair endonuclease [Promethearchaeota archaeon]
MADHLSKEKRSWNMSRIHSENTKPEIVVRSLLHQMGYRFRLHRKDLPGKPDIVLKKYNTVIFVHGCFWHHHNNCKRANIPKSNTDYWIPKIQKNVERDKNQKKKLKKLGWKVIVIWECEIKNINRLSKKLTKRISNLV